jgi:hypothetical protein
VYTPHERAAIVMQTIADLIDSLCMGEPGEYCPARLNAMVDQTIIEMVKESETFDRADRFAIGLLSLLGSYLQGDELLQYRHPNDKLPDELSLIPPIKPGSVEEMLKLLRDGTEQEGE